MDFLQRLYEAPVSARSGSLLLREVAGTVVGIPGARDHAGVVEYMSYGVSTLIGSSVRAPAQNDTRPGIEALTQDPALR